MRFGKVGTYTSLCKQRINTKSATEAELVVIYDPMGQILWTRHFLFPRVYTYQQIQSPRITRVLYCYQNMGGCQAAGALDTFFCCSKNQKGRSKGCVLPYWEHAGRFLHKTTRRSSFLKDAGLYPFLADDILPGIFSDGKSSMF